MSEQQSICFLTSAEISPATGLPKWQRDRMLVDKDDLRDRFLEHGLQTNVAVVLDLPESGEENSRIIVAKNPTIQDDLILESDFHSAPIHDIGTVVIDRFSEGYARAKPGLTERTLNIFGVQRFGDDKWYSFVEGTDTSTPTIPTYRLSDTEQAIDELGDELGDVPCIVKPRSGSQGKGMYAFPSKKLLDLWLRDQRKLPEPSRPYKTFLDTYILQPAIDFTGELPYIKPFNEKDRVLVEARNDATTPKEIGLYCFYNAASDALECFPVPRRNVRTTIRQSIKPEWFFADPDPFVELLAASAQADLRLIAKKSGALAIYGRKDYGFGVLPGKTERQVFKIEDNLRGAYLMSTKRHPEIGNIIRTMFVNMAVGLARTAEH